MLIIVATFAWRLGRDLFGRYVGRHLGWWAIPALFAVSILVVVGWNAWRKRRNARRGGEFTPSTVAKQLADAGMTEPAFVEDGSLHGSSLFVVNQRAKVLELNTAYDIFGRDGARIGSVVQFAQTRGKLLVRLVTTLDQFFTHHFEVEDADGGVLLRLTRPAKFFRTSVHVFAEGDRFLGTLRQENVFGKIRFSITDATGTVVGQMRAEQLRAWDFRIVDAAGLDIAWIVKTWEGWAHTALTRADQYAVRIERPLPEPLRSLTLAAALVVDLALKQDARGAG